MECYFFLVVLLLVWYLCNCNVLIVCDFCVDFVLLLELLVEDLCRCLYMCCDELVEGELLVLLK